MPALDGKIAVEPITIDGQRGFRLSGRLNVDACYERTSCG
jgi:hypothetical protein